MEKKGGIVQGKMKKKGIRKGNKRKKKVKTKAYQGTNTMKRNDRKKIRNANMKILRKKEVHSNVKKESIHESRKRD